MKKAALGLVAILALTACSSSKKTSASTSSSSSASHSASASSTSSLMSKKDFAAQANLICADADKALTSLPKPTSDTDYPGYVLLLEGTQKAMDAYTTAMDSMIVQAADQTELRAKWYSVELADINAAKPLIAAAVLAAQHADATAFTSAIKAFNAAPDHSADYVQFQKDYGMTECAKLSG